MVEGKILRRNGEGKLGGKRSRCGEAAGNVETRSGGRKGTRKVSGQGVVIWEQQIDQEDLSAPVLSTFESTFFGIRSIGSEK